MIALGSDKNYEVAKGGDCGFVVDYDSVTPPQEPLSAYIVGAAYMAWAMGILLRLYLYLVNMTCTVVHCTVDI